ncbi:transglycosylase SLT domain-containing protein [Ferrimonas lipolytica]|uniref:Transglycosylase SLT domain-containing protein n=1 Tax=Ferrimonas lipolytica TaxID=2724191 RepID=A0A6H1UGZ6_9GAMM|nr:transglycosylase SLT domain-containing protein [Ferrimonas lipolytica]QIZ78377.1 transglycosylase SLT domain-containing protein [Ferrimonas lipolytica]
MRLSWLIAGACLTAATPISATDDEFEQFSANYMQEFEQFSMSYMDEFEQYQQQYLAALDQYRGTVLSNWDDGALSDNKAYVSYSDDQNIRTQVDFDQQQVVISVVHEPGQTPSPQQIQQQLDKLTQLTVAQAAANDPIESTKGSVSASQQAVVPSLNQASKSDLDKMFALATVATRERHYDKARLATLEKQIEQQEQASAIALEQQLADNQQDGELRQAQARITQRAKQRQTKLAQEYAKRINDPAKKQITSYTISLPKDKLEQQVQPYLADAVTQAEKWQIDLSLVLAIMRAESSFNPMARSHIPAFGLMQIVPASAGLDVNQTLFNIKQKPSSTQLYQAPYNTQIGSAYLHILNSRYLKGITNPKSRRYCVIAAYNTGAGNVAKAFNSDHSRSVKKALTAINNMQPDEVYQHLLGNLPYSETQNYLAKVTKYDREFQQLRL